MSFLLLIDLPNLRNETSLRLPLISGYFIVYRENVWTLGCSYVPDAIYYKDSNNPKPDT